MPPEYPPGDSYWLIVAHAMLPGIKFCELSIDLFAPTTGCFVYRIWAEHELLYVGGTTNLRNRLRGHYADPRFDNADLVTVDPCERAAIGAKELHAIIHEKPRLNVAGVTHPYRSDGAWGRVR